MWVKAAHVIAIISWMAGMLYLPRLFIYHCDAAPGSELSETLKVMERRLLRVIINPAMGALLDSGALARLARRISDGGMVPRQARVRHRAVGIAWLPVGIRPALRRRSEHDVGPTLAHHQRGPGRPDGPHRHPGDRQAVLGVEGRRRPSIAGPLTHWVNSSQSGGGQRKFDAAARCPFDSEGTFAIELRLSDRVAASA